MKKSVTLMIIYTLFACLLCACAGNSQEVRTPSIGETQEPAVEQDMEDAPMYYTADSRITDVINDPAFGNYGRLIFPVDEWYYSGETLGELTGHGQDLRHSPGTQSQPDR